MANYVDYDYWLQGYGEGDLSQPDRYVVVGYWNDGYAQYEDVGSSAVITAAATVTAKAFDYTLATASITGTATVTAATAIDPYVVNGYWVGGYCEYDEIAPSISVNCIATLTASGTRIKTASGAFTGNAFLELNVNTVSTGSASITASGLISAKGSYVSNNHVVITGNGTVRALGGFITNGSAIVNVDATVGAIGDIIGYEWEEVTPESDTWTEQSAGSNVWQQVSADSTNWARQ